MKKATQKKRSTLVNGSVETQSYIAWIADLKRRYRATQIKAAVAVNSALIEFYWNLGKDITEKFAEGAPDTVLVFLRMSVLTCERNSRMTQVSRHGTSGIVRISTVCIPPRQFCHKLWQNLPRASMRIQKCHNLRQNVPTRN